MAKIDQEYPNFLQCRMEIHRKILKSGNLIPVEVKSGSEGKLRSLHLFMDAAPHAIAVRIYAGAVSITKATTPEGKQIKLLNLPYYAVSQIEKYLVWLKTQDWCYIADNRILESQSILRTLRNEYYVTYFVKWENQPIHSFYPAIIALPIFATAKMSWPGWHSKGWARLCALFLGKI